MNTMNNIKHTPNCSRVFKNYDLTCPRCIELSKGAKPRDGWQADYYSRKDSQDKARAKAIKNHDCIKSNCGAVCTAFEW
jgi:hypothetical protein